jgi:hypothetical protein
MQTCPEPVWKEYSTFKPHEVARERARLEKMLETKTHLSPDSADSGKVTLSELEIKQRLFELSIHHSNRKFSPQEVYKYITYLYQNGAPDSLRYLNWGRIIREQEMLAHQKDSLESVMSALSGEEQKQSELVEKLRRESRNCLSDRDSLTTVIAAQKETIQKLQKLDVLMEQQRSKIQ